MNILFTVCGRAGSKGIKNKNVRNFLGHPLPLYTISAIDLFLKDNKEVSADIALNTDSDELVRIFEKNCMRPFTFIPRKDSLAGDKAGKLDVIKDTYKEMVQKGRAYDYVIDMDLTSPLRRKNDLFRVVEEIKKGDYDAVITITDARRNPYFNMVKSDDDHYYDKVLSSTYKTRQQTPAVYDMNASIYAYNPGFLVSADNIFSGKCGAVRMYDTGILDLDHENDFELMEVIARYLVDSDPDFSTVFNNVFNTYDQGNIE